uniref:Mitochondrial import receptor subunit TOM40 n=1 Tax=Spongospora subterranea TaxID=70186 RepID=A0A0H5RMA9_9EUKA|eukprot:CRZ09859.1 hypothetical protein [Spongospora subterranea]
MEGIVDSITSFFRSSPDPSPAKLAAPAQVPSTPALPKKTVPVAVADEDLGQQAYKEAAAERARRARRHVLSQTAVALPSPGRMDDINREASDVLQVPTYDGVRVEYHKPVVQSADKTMTYSHLLWLGPQHLHGGSSYEFATQLQLGNVTLMSQLDTNGILNGRYHHQFGSSLLTKLQFAVAPSSKRQVDMVLGEVDYVDSDFSANLKVSHDGMIVASYLQSITPTISTGVECLVQTSELVAHSRYVARYDSKLGGDNVNVSLLDQGTVHVSYAHRVSPRLTLASEFKFDPNTRESNAKVGWKWSLRQSQLRATIDTNGVVCASMDEAITPIIRLSLNGEIDHSSQQYKFGMGVSVG